MDGYALTYKQSASGIWGRDTQRLSLARPRGTPSKNDRAGVERLFESLLAQSFGGGA
jgi:hypothetical protein